MTLTTTSAIGRRPVSFIGGTLLLALAAAFMAGAGTAQAEDSRPALRLQTKPQPPQPGKEVFVRTKPHVNVGSGPSRPAGVPQGPSGLKGEVPELADWYCGKGAGPGGHAVCTPDLIASCNGTYKPPYTNGPNQTWGMCHERS